MKLRYALIIAILLTGLIACDSYIAHTLNSKAKEKDIVTISRVIDGDTIVLEDNRHIRLLNINAPEKNTPLSARSIAFVKQFENKSVEIDITGTDKYNRYLARIYTPDYLNLNLISLGLASKFLVDQNELSKFTEAEKNAITLGLGIWNKSVYFGCFESKIDQLKEIVYLKNHCQNISMSGWEIKDESRKIYKFRNISLGEIRIHSLNGKDNSTDLFWNNKGSIWNDDRDSLYLFDDKENIVGYETYGY